MEGMPSSIHRKGLGSGAGACAMAIEVAELDAMQATYHDAVEEWVKTIREEEALAAVEHSVADVDAWEAACSREGDARKRARTAKKEYEDALREEFFGF